MALRADPPPAGGRAGEAHPAGKRRHRRRLEVRAVMESAVADAGRDDGTRFYQRVGNRLEVRLRRRKQRSIGGDIRNELIVSLDFFLEEYGSRRVARIFTGTEEPLIGCGHILQPHQFRLATLNVA